MAHKFFVCGMMGRFEC